MSGGRRPDAGERLAYEGADDPRRDPDDPHPAGARSSGDPQHPAGARELLVPVLRGVSHVYSAYVAAAAGVVLVLVATDATARWCSVLYAVALIALFGISGLFHRWKWDPRWQPVLRRLDHCTIFVFIASCVTVLAVEVLTGPTQVVVLALAWGGALAGVALSLAWIDAPRSVAAGSYVLVSWAAAIGLPQMIDRLSPAPLILMGVGGFLYMVGAVVYATQRPDPWPRVFGFHEIFHALVIAGATVHFVALAGWILR